MVSPSQQLSRQIVCASDESPRLHFANHLIRPLFCHFLELFLDLVLSLLSTVSDALVCHVSRKPLCALALFYLYPFLGQLGNLRSQEWATNDHFLHAVTESIVEDLLSNNGVVGPPSCA